MRRQAETPNQSTPEPADAPKITRLILLGTQGGPVPSSVAICWSFDGGGAPACAGLFLIRDRLVRAHGTAAPVTGRLDPALVDAALVHEIAPDGAGHVRLGGDPGKAGSGGIVKVAQHLDDAIGPARRIAGRHLHDLELPGPPTAQTPCPLPPVHDH